MSVIKTSLIDKRNVLTKKVYHEANILMYVNDELCPFSFKSIVFVIFRDLRHQNVCTFHGCLLNDSYTALLYEFCSRGSLESILLRSDIQFDWVFRLSFAQDAARAMAFLHSKKIVHGRLKTRNCMIDEQWTLKIQGRTMPVSKHTHCSNLHAIYVRLN